jgi:SAM-dependent methyltransferase
VQLDFDQIDAVCDALNVLSQRVSLTALPLELAKAKDFDPEHRKLGLEVFLGRRKVATYIPELAMGYFTQRGLEQRTHPQIAAHHARFFASTDTVLEVGCGLGFDTMHLARQAHAVVSLDIDPVHVAFATRNLALTGSSNVTILEMSYEQYLASSASHGCTALWADPMRRSHDGTRTKVAEEFSPPLSLLMSTSLMPAVMKINPTNKASYPGWHAQWIGFQKECKEKLLIKSGADTSHLPTVCLLDTATDIFTDAFVHESNPHLTQIPELPCVCLEPHAALLAAECSDQYFAAAGCAVLPKPGKLGVCSVEHYQEHRHRLERVAEAFLIDAIEPYRLANLKKLFAARGWDSRTELKKANFQEEPEQLRKQLGLTTRRTDEDVPHGVAIFTSFYDKKIVCLGTRMTP